MGLVAYQTKLSSYFEKCELSELTINTETLVDPFETFVCTLEQCESKSYDFQNFLCH